MFEPNQETQNQVDAVYEHCLPLDRGDTLTWEAITSLTGLQRGCDESRFRYVVAKLRRRLRENREIVTWPANGIGLRLLTHEEAAAVPAEKRRRKMYRQAGMALREMRCADVNHLSIHQRRVHASQLERFLAERKSIRAGVKEIIKRSDPLPQRKIEIVNA